MLPLLAVTDETAKLTTAESDISISYKRKQHGYVTPLGHHYIQITCWNVATDRKKLAPCTTDGQLFTTDDSAKFKVT